MYTKPISYSGLSLYKKCPRAWKDAYIDGNRSPSGAAANRGTELHALLEHFFKTGEYPDQHKVLAPWKPVMEERRARGAEPEKQVAVTKYWEPTEFDNPEAYFRGAIDLTYWHDKVLVIVDFKSGRVYDTHVDQGLAYLALSPPTTLVRVEFHYLDLPTEIIKWAYTESDRQQQIAKLIQDIEVLRHDETFAPRPSRNSCRYCSLSWRQGGACRAAP